MADRGGKNRTAGPADPGFAYRVTVAVLIVILIGGAAYLLWQAVHTLLLAFAGVLFALFLSALADWLRRRAGIRYGWSLAVVVATLLVLAVGIGWLLANSLAAQLAALSETLPQALDRLREVMASYSWGRLILEQAPRAAEATAAQAGDVSRLTGVLSGVSGFLVAGVVILFVGLFVAAEPELYRAGLLHLVPPANRRRADQTLTAVGYNLRWWLVGQATLMVTMAVTTTVGLWLIGVPLPLALGLIAGIFELVPYVGPWLSAVPAALVALMVSTWHLGMVLGLYLALHMLEGYVLVPLIQRRAARLPPALTILGQFLFAELFGIIGLFVAAPLTVVAVVALKMLYVEDALGDETVDVPGEPGDDGKSPGRSGAAKSG
jgi:predicted PurR-regulated permease PerM